MDNEVELVETNKRPTNVVKMGAVPRKGLANRRNPCFAFFSISFVLAAVVVVVGKFYLNTPEPGPNGREPEQEIVDGGWLDATVSLDDGVMFEVEERLLHDKKAFTEGLTFANGMLYESTGLNGKSEVRTINKTTGEILEKYPMASTYFGEGLTYVKGKLYQLTWKAQVGFIYDASDLSAPPQQFNFSCTRNEGWGLTYDEVNNELIESDGSDYLHFWDPETLQEKRKIKVTRMYDKSAKNINELEYWRGRVLANVWYEDSIIVIDPSTGIVEKEYDFSTLWPLQERSSQRADVLNGISVSEDPDLLYITGKNWDRMFLVSSLSRPSYDFPYGSNMSAI